MLQSNIRSYLIGSLFIESQGRGGRMMDDPQPNRRPASQMVQTVIEVQSPYKGWKYYFPEEGNYKQTFTHAHSLLITYI